jgi:ribosomal protein S18 acetylase RimI-like enzyme
MLFASTSLAGRIERADASLLAESALASAERLGDARGFVTRLAGGVASYAGAGSPLNKVAALGFAGDLDERELAAVERAYAARGCPVQVELSALADPSIGALLTNRGYTLVGFENVLGRRLPAAADAHPPREIAISESTADELASWLDVLIDGFALPDTQGVVSHEEFPRAALEAVLGAMTASAGFHRYLARVGGALAGGAGLRVCDGVAQLCGAATLPALRRRGVQTALLAERLSVASRAGCDVAVVTTQPGSKSQENAQRQGFDLLYARAILVRKAPPA